MPLINRIEIANFMNRGRREPWRPDWIHQVLNLNGYSTAINMPNGLGKSTIAQGVLAMLTYDKSLNSLRANHFAPQSNGRFTHLRVEFLIPSSDPTALDMIAQAGGGAGGDPIVFGMYGNAGENGQFRLYAYPGRLEDCPVGMREGVRYVPASNAEFLAGLEKIPERFPRAREDTRGSWRAYVSAIFDMPAVEQQLAYQKNKGGEGSSGYFDVSVPGGKDYAEAVFYERLAPELLTDLMSGVEGHDDEIGIEDTIHAKVQGIIKARARTEWAKKALERTQQLLEEFNWAQGMGAKVEGAQARFSRAQTALAVHAAVMRMLVADNPLPGLLRTPGADAPELANSLVMQGDRWFAPDSVFERITGDEPNEINRRADRNRIASISAERSQLIDFACHSFSTIPKRGPAGRLYELDAALAILAATTEFPKLYTRESAAEAMHAAFEWAQAHADTNPARLERHRLEAEEADARERYAKGDETRSHLASEKEALLQEQRSVGAQQSAFEKMANSGVFSAAELKRPDEAGQTVKNELRIADNAYQSHVKNVAASQDAYRAWRDFVAEYGENGQPAAVHEQLEAARDAALKVRETTKSELDQAREAARKAAKDEETARAEQRKVESAVDRLVKLRPLVNAYLARFGDEPAQGLAVSVRQTFDEARQRESKVEQQRAAMKGALSALNGFNAAQPGEDPKAWLQAREEASTALLMQRPAAQAGLDNLKAQRDAFDRGATVAPGAEARAALQIAGSAAIALHDAVNAFALEPERRARVLAMFSALLFTPILPDVDSASTVANRLAEEKLDVPVFSKDEFEEFCRNTSIDYDGHVAHTWLVGVRTRPVDCLLDPALVEAERARLAESITKADGTLANIDKHLADLSSKHPTAQLAQRALEAIDHGYAVRDKELASELAAIQEQMPQLRDRASDEALTSIHAMGQYEELLKDSTLEAEQERLARAEEATLACEKKREALDFAVNELEEVSRQREQALLEATEQLAKKGQVLNRVAKFTEVGGPEFMQTAPENEKRLATELAAARLRTGFEFDLAAAFVRAGEQRPKEITTRLAQIGPEMDRLVVSINLTKARIEEIAKLLPVLISDATSIDNAARSLRRQYRALPSIEPLPGTITQEAMQENALFGASLAVRQAQTTQQLVAAWSTMSDAMEDDAGQGLVTEHREAQAEHASALKAFHDAVDRVKGNTLLPLDDQMRIGLEQAKSNPAELTRILDATQENFERSRLANEAAQKHLDTEWDGIGDWLTNFTLRLPSNFQAMQRSFRPKRNAATGLITSAGFEIDATLADTHDVRRVLDGLVDDVERREKARASMGDIELSQPERESEKRNVRRQIRSKFYRSVLLEPKIKVCMPAISQKSLKLEKNMFSSGQGIAMTLLWIRKMADYVSERELSRQTVGARQRRQIRDRRTQFVIIDGAFSHLSDKRLITDALDGVKDKQGTFQLIITGHDPHYRNDYDYFPSYVAAREIGDGLSYAVNEHEIVEPEAIGSHVGAVEIGSWHRHVGVA